MRYERATHRFLLPLAILLVALFVVVPSLELVCDGSAVDQHEYSHLHASPAVISEAVRVPVLHLVRLGFVRDRSVDFVDAVVAAFVPPRL